MTEKRFVFMEDYDWWEIKDGEHNLLTIKEVTDLLNELHEEKEDLVTKKEDAEYELLHLKEKYEELLEENEQLKQFIQGLTTKGTGKIHLANGSIYKVDAILINIKG